MRTLEGQNGRWTLTERLGSGGMGEVWRADPRAAVKLLTVRNDDLARHRFRQEVQALMALAHPNVVRAFDYGETPEHVPWLAMELLEGESLLDRLERAGPISAPEAVRLGCAATEALAEAHARGLVHRDVKPGNVFLCDDGRVVVLDFGLAVLADMEDPGPDSDGWTRVSRAGEIVGTPSYMAPEQTREGGTVDGRTDVWALGATLHHALAGQPPFWAGGHIMAELVRILTEPPDSLPSDVPPALRAALTIALDKEAARRWPTMSAFRAALGDVELGSEPARAHPRTPAPRLELSDEVRVVSALVATDVSEPLLLLAEVLRQGGRGAALRGRRVVAAFGQAEWVGDEPDRAVRAALAARGWAGRIGVGTGRALRAAAASGLLMGDAVAAAERAGALAPPSGVAACPQTRQRLAAAFELDGDVVVRARAAEPEAPFDDSGTGRRSAAGGPAAGPRLMFGRANELGRLVDAVERAAQGARAQAILLHGPAGIGKSRLLAELRRAVESWPQPVRVVEGRGEPTRAMTPLAALAGALRTCAGLPEGTPAREAQEKIETLVAGAALPRAKWLATAEFLGQLLGAPYPERAQTRLASQEPGVMADRVRLAIGDLFEAWCSRGPVLLVVDDLHHADDLSLDTIEFLRARLEERPFAVAAAARPELFATRPRALQGAERVELRELRAADIEALARGVLGPPPEESSADWPRVVRRIGERAAGNPYFAEELALAVRDGADPEALPLTVHAVAQSRLDRLEPRQKDLLKRASVLGRRFWAEALEALGEPDAPALLEALRERGLIVRRPQPRLAGCTEWLVRHGVVHEVAYDMLTDPQRRALHAHAAAWLGARADAPPDEVAEHFERAGQPERALEHWLRATHAADAAGASEKALAFSERVVAALRNGAEPPGAGGGRPRAAVLTAPEEYALRLIRADALRWLGRTDEEAEEHAAISAAELRADEAGTPVPCVAAVRARLGLSAFQFRRGRTAEAVAAAETAVTAAEAGGERTWAARARGALAQRLAQADRLDDAEREARRAASDADEGEDVAARAYAHVAWAYVAAVRGRPGEALAGFSAGRRLQQGAGLVRQAAHALMNEGAVLQTLGADGAAEALRDALGAARALGLRNVKGWALTNLGLVLGRAGEVAAALAAEDAALEIAHAAREATLEVAALMNRAFIAREAGRPERALRDAEAAIAACAARPPMEAQARTARAAALLDLGRVEECLTETERALAARDRTGGMEGREVDLLLLRHDALAAAGRGADARSALVAARACLDALLARLDDPHRQSVAAIGAHARVLALTR